MGKEQRNISNTRSRRRKRGLFEIYKCREIECEGLLYKVRYRSIKVLYISATL